MGVGYAGKSYILGQGMQERIESIVKEACTVNGVALYDMELKATGHGKILVVYITSLTGVKVHDCQHVSRMIEHQLEAEDLIPGSYFLEVSSPGLERDLKKKIHFVSAINERIKVTVQGEEQNRHLIGILTEVNQDRISLLLETGEQEEILLNRIRKAKTMHDHKKDLQKSNKADKMKEN